MSGKQFFLFFLKYVIYLFIAFLGLHPQHVEVPGLGVESELQPQQLRIQAISATYNTAHGNAGSLTH